MPPNHLDPVNVAIALAGILFGPTLAAVVGPYAVIIIAATVGAAWSLGRREPAPRLGAAWYFVRLQATAILVTASLASAAARWLDLEDHTWLLAPIALLVGGVGDDWPRLVRWLLARVQRLIDRRARGTPGGGPDHG